ncbi:MAG: gas vesicle protein GvpG [Chloroflexi bacterium]|nr:gas vesicle protein GvpG [Chloroflexota bacterium]
MGLFDILTFPVSAPIKGVIWLAEKIAEQVDHEYYSEEAIRRQLMDLELKFDLGEINEEAYMAAEEELLALLKQVRELKRAAAEEAGGDEDEDEDEDED